jgi:hypothetical protein
MHLNLTDEEAASLTRFLGTSIVDDRCPLSPRIRTLKAILDKLDPPPVRKPLPPLANEGLGHI